MQCKTTLLLVFSGPFFLWSQTQPRVYFSFDNKTSVDKVSNLVPKLVNASFTEDRFGNKDHAIHLFGNANSYLNLGSSPLLKPKTGSLSFWVRVENTLWYGTGYKTNPFILTKRSKEDDFFEAYALYYMFETKKVAALCTKDSTNQVFFSSKNNFDIQKWHHLVFTYDKDSAAFYIDGELDNRFKTGFELEFLEDDSVLVGVTNNKKNNRFFSGSIDDIQFYHQVLTDQEVKALYHSPDPNRLRVLFDSLKLGAGFAVLALLMYVLVRRHLKRKLKQYQETLKLQTRLLETELRVNRALMNPHFIFNSLNSIQNLILNKHNDEANVYLLKFSKLMRKILESNTSENISLADEIDILKRYLELEQLRFQEDFTYSITLDDSVKSTQIRIPIMMIQPFVENAIWHGLMNKEGERILKIRFSSEDDKYLLCIVEDNGLGRVERENVLKEKKSMATIFVRSRLDLINKIHNLECDLKIIDKPNFGGTRVELKLPIVK